MQIHQPGRMDELQALGAPCGDVDVLNLLAPPSSLMSPGVAWRVLTRRKPAGEGSPWGATRTSDSPAAAPDSQRSMG